MRVPRLPILSLLISLCAVTAVAQSPSNKNSQPVLYRTAPATDLFQFQLSSDTDGQTPTPAPRTSENKNDSLDIRPLDSRTAHILTLRQNDATCYTLRTYRVARENPGSDATRPAGYSTCQPSTRFQVRTAVDSQVIVPR